MVRANALEKCLNNCIQSFEVFQGKAVSMEHKTYNHVIASILSHTHTHTHTHSYDTLTQTYTVTQTYTNCNAHVYTLSHKNCIHPDTLTHARTHAHTHTHASQSSDLCGLSCGSAGRWPGRTCGHTHHRCAAWLWSGSASGAAGSSPGEMSAGTLGRCKAVHCCVETCAPGDSERCRTFCCTLSIQMAWYLLVGVKKKKKKKFALWSKLMQS